MKSVFEIDTNGIAIDPVCKPRLQPMRSARNGMLVSAQYQGEIAALANQIARYRTKSYFQAGGDVVAPTDDKVYRFAGHIGPMAGSMVARVLMAPATQVTSTSNPRIQLALYNSSGTNIATQSAYFGTSYGKTPAETPEEWSVATIGIDVRDLRDTGFRAQLHAADEARLISCVVYETSIAPDISNGYLKQSYNAGGPILAADRSDLYTLATALYKRGGPSLFCYSSETDATPMETAFATYDYYYTNSRNGMFRLDQKFCNRKTSSTIPVKLECYAGYSGAGSGNVRVVDTAGNAWATFSISGAVGWQTAIAATLPNDERAYNIEIRSDGVNVLRLYALSCFRYQS